MTKTPEQLLDQAIFSRRHDNQLPDIRRFRLLVLADKKIGFWARVLKDLKYNIQRSKRQRDQHEPPGRIESPDSNRGRE